MYTRRHSPGEVARRRAQAANRLITLSGRPANKRMATDIEREQAWSTLESIVLPHSPQAPQDCSLPVTPKVLCKINVHLPTSDAVRTSDSFQIPLGISQFPHM